MKKIIEKFERIGVQATAWKFYGVITPLFFLLVFTAFHYMTDQSIDLMIFGWVLFMATCLIWWFWTIKIFQLLLESHKELFIIIKKVHEEVHLVKKDIRIIADEDRQHN